MHVTQPPLKTFGKFRNFLWPIHAHEHRKLLPMLALFFLISFIYNLLRCMKVTVVVTAKGSGAEVIPFLKVWAVLPAAVLITFLYTKLASRLTREQVFYTMISLFLGFFSIFLLVLHPNQEALELSTISEFLSPRLPEGLKGLIAVIRHWPLSLFYVLSEMWSAVVLSMLFWGFANEVTRIDEAKRFYAIFALGANFSGIFSGQSAKFLTFREYNPNFPFGKAAWEQTLNLQLGVVLLIGVFVIVLFRWVNRRVIADQEKEIVQQRLIPEESEKLNRAAELREVNKKLSLYECFAYLLKSPYMTYITILVVAYNIVYNLSDVLWTYQISQRYPDASEFNAYINHIASITGIFATLSGLILSGNVIRRYGWTTTALITPLIWLFTSVGFFTCMLVGENSAISNALVAFMNVPVYSLVLLFGSVQICLGRAAKYTVFDETKEIAFIPLPKDEQRKGKAVVDGIASRFGKSGGSLTIQVLLILCGELVLTIPYIAAIFLICISLWLLAVRRLGGLVAKSVDDPSSISVAETVSVLKNTRLPGAGPNTTSSLII
jgi:AAA family ATP:ADP antiporter